MIARLGLVICGCGGSGLVPPPLGPSSSRSTCVSARGTILSCLSGCCSEGPTWPLLRVSPGASEMVVDLSASGVTLVSLVPLPSESSISAPMQLYTMLTRSVDWMKTRMSKNIPSWFYILVKTPGYWPCPESMNCFRLLSTVKFLILAHFCQSICRGGKKNKWSFIQASVGILEIQIDFGDPNCVWTET